MSGTCTKSFPQLVTPIDKAKEWIFFHSSAFDCSIKSGGKARKNTLEFLIFCKVLIFLAFSDFLVDIFKFPIYLFRRYRDTQRQSKFNAHTLDCKIACNLNEILFVITSGHNTHVKYKILILTNTY